MATGDRRFRLFTAVAAVLAAFAGGLATGHLGLAGAQGGTGDPVFVALQAPVRYLDTRGAPFGPIGVPAAAPVGPQSTTDIAIAGASVSGTAYVPLTARSVLVNVTAVNATAESFVTAYAAEADRPNASTMNPEPGRTTFNTATVSMGASGRMRLYNNAGSVNLVVDVVGYFIDHDHDDRYYTIPEIDARVPRQQSVTISGAGFSINDSSANFERTLGGCFTPLGTTMSAHAAVPIPSGTSITSFTARMEDNDPAAALNVELYVQNATGVATQIGATDSLSGSGVVIVDRVLATPHVVADDEAVQILAGSSGSSTQLRVCSVTIHYTLPG